jgi:hypothetical protein
MKMKSAWIITQEGTSHPERVIGILSARKSAEKIKEHVEWLYALLHYYPEEHLSLAKYNNPSNPYKAEYWTTNLGAPVRTMMMCGHNPYLVARYARNISLLGDYPDTQFLKWTEPDRLVCDPRTLHVIERVSGMVLQAPVNLPLRMADGFDS